MLRKRKSMMKILKKGKRLKKTRKRKWKIRFFI